MFQRQPNNFSINCIERLKLEILEILPNFVVNLLSLLASIAVNNKSKHIFLSNFFLSDFSKFFRWLSGNFAVETFQVSENFPGNFRKLPESFKPCDVSLALVLGPCLSLRTDLQVLGLDSRTWVKSLALALKLKSLALKLKSLAWALALKPKSLALALNPKSLLTSLLLGSQGY